MPLSSKWKSGLGVLCLGVPAALYGQFELPAPSQDQIVVIGRPVDDQLLREFVNEVGQETGEDQYGRWYDKACPAVVGLREEFSNYVLGTIRSVAELVDAPIEDEDCRANIVIMFTIEPQETVTQLQQSHPGFFGEIPPARVVRMVSADAPVSVLSRISTRGGGGQYGASYVVAGEREDTRVGARSGSERPDTKVERASTALPGEAAQGGSIHQQAEGSRVSRATRPEFDFRLIVIDLNQLEGQTIRQLSAYAAMVALGDFTLNHPIASQQSILNAAYDPAGAPPDITDWDLAYLSALYRMQPARSASSQRRAMFAVSRRALERGNFQNP